MSKLKNILHSWDEADAYLKEKIEKSENEVLNKTVSHEQFVAENMISMPHSGTQDGERGFVWTDNHDGSTSVSGTPNTTGTTRTYYRIVGPGDTGIKLKKDTWYTLSHDDTTGMIFSSVIFPRSMRAERLNPYHEIFSTSDMGTARTINGIFNVYPYVTFKLLDEDVELNEVILRAKNITDNDGVPYTLDNVKVHVMLEEGKIPHAYQPYLYSRKSLEARISALESALASVTALSEDTENA